MNDEANTRLRGISVLVTRPQGREQGLLNLIRSSGGQAHHLPCLAIESIAPSERATTRSAYDWLIFISVNAVKHFGARERWPEGRIAAIGASTANAIAETGSGPHLLPESGYTSENMLATPDMLAVAGQNILIIRGEGGRETLADTLRSRGANIEHAEVYRRVVPDLDPTPITLDWLRAGEPILTVSSGEALDNFMSMIDEQTRARLNDVTLIAPSERVAAQARTLADFAAVHAASDATDKAVFETIVQVIPLS
ncbi:MAG: uroporphyrinogen-III synthase [Gammaproteobacteria bacterium]